MHELVFFDDDDNKLTFIVDVVKKQHFTWHGKIKCVESKKEASFRSTLELIRIMDRNVNDTSGKLDSDEDDIVR